MTATYNGSHRLRSALIDVDTNPWMEVVGGRPIDWTRWDARRLPCPCGESGDVIVSGVLDEVDGPFGVQRCDACGIYEGDREAALVLAALVGGTVRFAVDVS